jgi:ethanolamine utilization cobalamin adenosyltransferase
MNRNSNTNEIAKIAKSVMLDGYVYGVSPDNHIAINKIIIIFNDETKIALRAKTDLPELFTVFTDIKREHDILNILFDIRKAICDKIIYSISFTDESEFTDTLNGYYVFYNKITIHYGDNELYEFYVLQSSNGHLCGYFIIE